MPRPLDQEEAFDQIATADSVAHTFLRNVCAHSSNVFARSCAEVAQPWHYWSSPGRTAIHPSGCPLGLIPSPTITLPSWDVPWA